MKSILLFACLFFLSMHALSQLKTTTLCPTITVDVLGGKVNDMEPDFTQGQIKKTLPCTTKEEPESSASTCGGLLAYKDKDIYFYTGRNYVEIGPAFKGKLSIPLMGASRTGLFRYLGNAAIKDVSWDAYTTKYGVLILYFNKANKVNKIRFSTESSATINLCE